MPTSIDPQPADNEFECANCGAYFDYELTRCPNCGVNIYEPEDEPSSGFILSPGNHTPLMNCLVPQLIRRIYSTTRCSGLAVTGQLRSV